MGNGIFLSSSGNGLVDAADAATDELLFHRFSLSLFYCAKSIVIYVDLRTQHGR